MKYETIRKYKDDDGEPIGDKAIAQHVEALKLLLSKGAEVDARNRVAYIHLKKCSAACLCVFYGFD